MPNAGWRIYNYVADCWLLIADWKNKKQTATSNKQKANEKNKRARLK